MNKSLTENDIKRLIFRSMHRGCKETDLVLGQFAETQLKYLKEPLLSAYAALLDENDADIWDWLTGKHPPARPEYAKLIEMLKHGGHLV